MQRHAARLRVYALIALLCLCAPLPVQADPRPAAIVTAVPGGAFYQRNGIGPFLPLRLHAPLYPGDIVQTGPDAAEILYTDSGSSVKIDSNSTTRILAGDPAPHRQTLLQVIIGVIWAHLRPGAEIETPRQTNLAARGTEVLVSVTADGATTLTVVEGDVTFSNPQGTRELLTAQQSIALPGQAPTAPVAVDVSGLIAWTFNVAALPLEFELPPTPLGQAVPTDAVAALLRQGQQRRDVGDLPGALDAYRQAIHLDDSSTEARVGLALTYLSQGQTTQAHAALEPARSQPVALAALGLTDLHEGRGADAERDLRAALALDPHLYTANALLALAYLDRNDLPDAQTASRLAVADRPDSAQTQGTRAMVLFFAGQTGAAEDASRRAIRLDPLSPFALLTEGRALLARGQTDAARAAYEKAAAIAPDLWLTHQELGAVYLRLDMPRKADEEYRAALTLDPNSADSHTGLGLSFQSRGRYTEAEAEHRRALALDPNNATAHYDLATLLIDRGRLDEARQELESGVRAAPERGVLYARLAEISLYRQDLFSAQEFARRAVSLLPNSAFAHYELGRVYLEQERTLQAEQEFRQATTLNPQDAAARYALGLTQEKTDAGLINSFSTLLGSAFVGSPASGNDITNLQTPGANQRIQAALLDPTVARSASRAYGDTQLGVTLGQQASHDLAGSYLTETRDGRGVRGINAEEQYTNGVRANADSKLDTASVIVGQKAAGNSSGYLVLGDYEETSVGLDNEVISNPANTGLRFRTQLPRLVAGVNFQNAKGSRVRALIQISRKEESDHDANDSSFQFKTQFDSVDVESRWDVDLGGANQLSLGFSYGSRRKQISSSDNSIPGVPPFHETDTVYIQPLQGYARDDFQVSTRLSLTGQIQILSLKTNYQGEDQWTAVGLPTAVATYQSNIRNVFRFRARRLFATIQDFQLLTPTDVFLLNFAGLPQPILFLPPSDGSSIEMEYDHTFANASFLSIDLFQQKQRLAVVLDSPNGPYDNARVQGIQASYQGLVGHEVSFFLNGEINRSEDTNLHRRVAQVPDYSGVIGLQYLSRRGYYAQSAYYYQGNRVFEDTDINGNYDPTRLGGFGLLNLRAGKRTGLRSNFFIELDNVSNRQYDIYGTLHTGREILVGASERF